MWLKDSSRPSFLYNSSFNNLLFGRSKEKKEDTQSTRVLTSKLVGKWLSANRQLLDHIDPGFLPWFLFLVLFFFQVGEVGELSEIFQWKGEVERGLPNWKTSEKEHLGEELSDVLLYLVRLADICGVDLGQAAMKKLIKNGTKYPVETCKISSYLYAQAQKLPLWISCECTTTQIQIRPIYFSQ